MASKTGYDQFGDQKPKELKIRLPMVADCSVETAVDIDTGLDAGDKLGWTLVGLDYCFRAVATPHMTVLPSVAASRAYHTQLCRGESPDTPVLLDPGSNDVIYDSIFLNHFATGVGFQFDRDGWIRVRKPERTQMSALHLVFGTSSDDANLSTTAVEMYAVAYYYLVNAPEKSGHEE